MSKTALIVIGVVLLVAAGGGGAYLLTRGNDTASDSTQNTADQSKQENGTKSEASFSSVANGGKAQKCTFTYEGSDGNGTGTMYGDGDGRGFMTMEVKSAKGNTGTSNTLTTADKAYGWFETGGKKTGFAFDKSTFENRAGSNQTSSTAGTDPSKKFTMDCQDWTVDESLFSVPSDVTFITLPSGS